MFINKFIDDLLEEYRVISITSTIYQDLFNIDERASLLGRI